MFLCHLLPIICKVNSSMNDEPSKSLQEKWAPNSTCFGCGPANERGLQIRSFYDQSGEKPVCWADWTAKPQHEAFSGFLNGGIASSLLDCHCNWAAIAYVVNETQTDEVPCTVTANLSVEFLAPTPTKEPIRLLAQLIDASDRRFGVEGQIVADGVVSVRCKATFVAVKPGHPAYHRWDP